MIKEAFVEKFFVCAVIPRQSSGDESDKPNCVEITVVRWIHLVDDRMKSILPADSLFVFESYFLLIISSSSESVNFPLLSVIRRLNSNCNSLCRLSTKPELSAEMTQPGDYAAVGEDIAAQLKKPNYDDGSAGPVFVRLAW